MSVQIAKSPSGNTTASRRTPLSLNASSGTKATKIQVIDSNNESTSTDESSSDLNKTAQKNSEKTDNISTDAKKSNDNKQIEKQSTGSHSAKDKSADDNKKKDDKKEKDKEDKKHENGLHEIKSGKVEDAKKSSGVDKSDIKVPVRESPRQKAAKEIKDIKDKEERHTGTTDKRKIENKTGKIEDKRKSIDIKVDGTKGKQDKKDQTEKSEQLEKRIEKAEEIAKKQEDKPESSLIIEQKDNERSINDIKEVISSIKKSNYDDNYEKNTSLISLNQENNEFNGHSSGEDMEPLVSESEIDTKEPIRTSTPGKALKASDLSKKEIEQKVDNGEKLEYKKLLNEEEHEKSALGYSASTSSTLERPYYTSSLRTISGRRSLRPMKEYSFQSQYKESYRKINTELDYTSSSVNVTVGSEIPNESTFSFFGRGKKRERTPPLSTSNIINASEIQGDVELSPKSPKRARLDFSGFLDIVSSPVSMLRAKFSKTKIQCSTPNTKVTTSNDNNKDDQEGLENVSIIATDEMVSETAEDIQPEDYVESVKDIEIDENIDISNDDKKDSKMVITSIESINKRRMCRIM